METSMLCKIYHTSLVKHYAAFLLNNYSDTILHLFNT